MAIWATVLSNLGSSRLSARRIIGDSCRWRSMTSLVISVNRYWSIADPSVYRKSVKPRLVDVCFLSFGERGEREEIEERKRERRIVRVNFVPGIWFIDSPSAERKETVHGIPITRSCPCLSRSSTISIGRSSCCACWICWSWSIFGNELEGWVGWSPCCRRSSSSRRAKVSSKRCGVCSSLLNNARD